MIESLAVEAMQDSGPRAREGAAATLHRAGRVLRLPGHARAQTGKSSEVS